MRFRCYISSDPGTAAAESIGYYFLPAALFAGAGGGLFTLWGGFTVIFGVICAVFILRWTLDFFSDYVLFDGNTATLHTPLGKIGYGLSEIVYAECVGEIMIPVSLIRSRVRRCDKIIFCNAGRETMFYLSDTPKTRGFVRDTLGIPLIGAESDGTEV